MKSLVDLRGTKFWVLGVAALVALHTYIQHVIPTFKSEARHHLILGTRWGR
jgi:hypothetical protein